MLPPVTAQLADVAGQLGGGQAVGRRPAGRALAELGAGEVAVAVVQAPQLRRHRVIVIAGRYDGDGPAPCR